MDEHEAEIFGDFKEVLQEAGFSKDYSLSEFNVIHSLPGCVAQKMHWDYDPTVVRYKRRKPCSAILALSAGARLYVRDTHLGMDVTVLIPPGAIMIFDGDVAHAGASYAGPNTRVHLYLDVPGVARDQDYTWFPGM